MKVKHYSYGTLNMGALWLFCLTCFPLTTLVFIIWFAFYLVKRRKYQRKLAELAPPEALQPTVGVPYME